MSLRKEVPLYGEAAAIRVLYQTSIVETSAPKPRRPKRERGRGSWVAPILDWLSPALHDPAASKA
jgi:hypothetical protein